LRRYFRLLYLLLLQHALAPSSIDAHTRSRLPVNSSGSLDSESASRPYLKIASMLPLRIRATPPPDLVAKPAGAPPQPAGRAADTASPSPKDPGSEPAALASGTVPATAPAPAPAASTDLSQPSTILPDDTRPATRPEDFLPFFQFPSGNHDVTIVVPVTAAHPPAPGQVPPSSATYQQK
jgi:hypothetical protein